MAGEIIYADLNIGPGERCGKRRSLPQPGTSACPRWHRTALWAGWIGTLLLGVAVVAMGCLVPHQQSENPGSCKNGSGNGGDGNITLESFRSELRKRLCSSKPPEGEGLCESGAELLMPEDQAELVKGRMAIGGVGWVRDCTEGLVAPGEGNLYRPSSYFWIGLSIPSAGKGWTWLNGSRLDESRFWLRPRDEGRSCGVVRGNRISSASCSSESPWICQKDAVQL
ncbi:killer cell lectin-like receptor subfamily B member 1B allele C [Phoenicopterus ruber ruber]